MNRNEEVTCNNGKLAKRGDCRFIDGKFYKMNEECFLIENPEGRKQWYRINSPNIERDCITGEYYDVRTVGPVANCVIDVTDDGKLIYGKYKMYGKEYERYFQIKNILPLYTCIVTRLRFLNKNIYIKYIKSIGLDFENDVYICHQNNQYVNAKSNYFVREWKTNKPLFTEYATKVIVDIKETKEPVIGWVEHRGDVHIVEKVHGNYILNEEIANKMGLVEDIYDGQWTLPNKVTKKKGYKIQTDRFYSKQSDLIKYSTNDIAQGLPYCFGIEIESSKGCVPVHLYKKFPFKCVRDGSLPEEGGEYVSDVLEKDGGFTLIEEFCKELRKRCEINHQTSIHVHIGNVPCTKLFNVASFILGMRLQEEIFKMLPYSRTQFNYCPEKFPIRKNYCKWLPLNVIHKAKITFLYSLINSPIDKIESLLYKDVLVYKDEEINDKIEVLKEMFDTRSIKLAIRNKNLVELKQLAINSYISFLDKLVNRFVLDNTDVKVPIDFYRKTDFHGEFNRKSRLHMGHNKWSRNSRYYYINHNNLIYNDIERCSLEFRAHSGTFNYTKIKNWILINMAFCKFAESNPKRIFDLSKSITLEEIIRYTYKEPDEILSYIQMRKDKFNDGKADNVEVEIGEYTYDLV